LSADLVVTSSQGDRLQADIGLPVHFTLWPPHWTQPTSDFRAHISTDTDVRILDWLPVLHEAIIEGRVVAELTYRGSAEAGSVQGQAQWVDGYYEDILLGTVIQNIQAQLRAQGDTLILDEAVATDGDQGRLAIAGTLRMVPGLPYRIGVQADRFPWIQRADITTVASGEVTLAGTLHTMTLGGKLSLDEGLLDLSALPPAPPPVLISTRRDPTDVDASQPETLTVQGNLQLDLHKGFRIYGAGLDSIWDGQIHLAKADEHWDVTGSVSPRRGEFRLMGRPFRLTEGSIHLDGSWPIVPILDLTAVYARSGIEARVHITGRAGNPVIRIESDPPLPEDAILATVLFGRDLATITAMQALQLAAAVQSLHSPGGGADVFQRTRRAVGVDTIDFRQAEDPSDGSSIAVGKYLVPEVYVEVQQPLSSGGVTSTHIEYEIRPNLTIETDAGPGIRPGIGVNWKKDY
ncbi:translocation/assembly module TamB domain-containing protein, partial [Planctomycetota bacterium]